MGFGPGEKLRKALTAIVVAGAGTAFVTIAAPVAITNPGFEDVSVVGMTYNEFTFGALPGWSLYDRDNVVGSGVGPVYFPGTLAPQIIPARDPVNHQYFPAGAPEGQRVAIAFNYASAEPGREYGLQQTLAATLQPFTAYTLTVLVGNIASGYSLDGTFFNLDGFPGYRVDLLAGDTLLDSDNNTLTIAEGGWALSTVTFETTDTTAGLDELLRIRLVNLNAIDPAFPGADREVDFDQVMLTAVAVPEPATFGLLLAAALAMVVAARRLSRVRAGTLRKRHAFALPFAGDPAHVRP